MQSGKILLLHNRVNINVFNSREAPNAAHHPPRGPIDLLDSRRVRGRVHALVGRRGGDNLGPARLLD